MKRSLSISMPALLAASILAASCASAPARPASQASEAAPAKTAKQRTVVTKVPVLVKESSYYRDGLLDGYTVYKLDDAKKLVLEKDSFDPSRSDPIQRVVSEYKDGRLVAESTYESDGRLRDKKELGYDAAGRLLQERVLDGKGRLQTVSTYGYDSRDRRLLWKVADGSGTVKATTSYAYGADGLASIELRDAAGLLSGSIALEYAGGVLSKRSYLGPDGGLQKYEAYVYEGGRLAAVEQRRADGSLASKTAYQYGPSGELAKSVDYDAAGVAGNYSTYEYLVREDSSTETYYE